MNNNIPYTPPKFNTDGFNCPHCHAYADQHFGMTIMTVGERNYGLIQKYWASRCMRCSEFALWINEKLVYPTTQTAPAPNPDLPDDIKTDYDEAREILDKSPRGAAALLRLGIQKLCKELGEPGKNINADIGTLVEKGLSPKIQQALDILRVVGNHAVHPCQIDLDDKDDVAQKLFLILKILSTPNLNHIQIHETQQVRECFLSPYLARLILTS
ncbi:DUF4145 domain-containing protein [candidate division KSB1 bacterium]|nr:DUF4145 domain-containing protein [candidate division KSB1 bacterium]